MGIAKHTESNAAICAAIARAVGASPEPHHVHLRSRQPPEQDTYPDSTLVSFGYDSRNRRTSVTDQNANIREYAYDDADRLTSVIDAAHNQTLYDYDSENNLLSITDANLNKTSFSYDAYGRVTQTTFPAANSIETYVYDAIDNLTSKTDRKAQTINYIYDALNRLQHKGYPDATGVDYVYDLVGKIKQVTDPTGVYGFAYDNMGRLIGTSTSYSFLPGHTYTNSYSYDAASNRTSFTALDGTATTYSYDNLNRMTTLADSATGQFGFGYDALSRRTTMNRPNGVSTTYSYDPLSKLLSVLHKAGTATLDGADYVYDSSGNRTARSNYLTNITDQYSYDPLYRLTQVTQGTLATESYSYDAAGNRESPAGSDITVYNSSNEMLATSGTEYTFDGNGNVTTKSDSSGTRQYHWNYLNQLTSVVLPNGAGTSSFLYDPVGRRIQKSFTNGSSTTNTVYLYEGTDIVQEIDGTGNILVRFTPAGLDEHVAQVQSGTISYFEQDALGSVTSITNATGQLIRSYVYDSFGNAGASTGTLQNAFQYTGREYDAETGLYYFRARYYDPVAGRFLSEDPVRFEGGNNFYEYSYNSPINYSDPSGLQPLPAAPVPPQFTVYTGGGGAAGGAGAGTLLTVGGLVALDVGLAAYDAYLSAQLCAAYGVSWCAPSPSGSASPVRSPGTPPEANKNCPDCIRLMQQIKQVMDQIQNRIEDLLTDPRDLYTKARYLPNPAATGTSTTYQGHITQAQGKQNQLKSLLREAIMKNCPYPPGAWPLAMRGLPNMPRGR